MSMFRARLLFCPLSAILAAVFLAVLVLAGPVSAAAPADKTGKGDQAGQKQPAEDKKRANLPPGLFTSTLPSVPGRVVRESLGFHCQVFPYSAAEDYMAKMNQAMAAAQEKGKAMGANGFINLSITSVPLGGRAAPGRPQKSVQGVPIPPEMLDGPPPVDAIIHICGDFVRYE